MSRRSHQHPNGLDPERYRAAMTLPTAVEKLGIRTNGNGFCHAWERSESKPSIKIYSDHLYDFGAGKAYDLPGLVMSYLGKNFQEACLWIARETGLPEPKRHPEAQKRYEALQSISDTLESVFEDARVQPYIAEEYLIRRGIAEELIKDQVGFLPHDYRPKDKGAAQKAGLISRYGNMLHRGRAIIPVRHHGRIVNLYGRLIEPQEKRPVHVYCGSTDPPQPYTVWGLGDLHGKKQIYGCESIIDSLTLRTHGYDAVAFFGTQGVNDARVGLLKDAGIEKVTLVFDSDRNESGQKGAMKAGERLFRAGIEVQIISLTLDAGEDKADPNSYFQNHTRQDFEELERRPYLAARLATIPKNVSAEKKYRALAPVLDLVAARPEALWKSYLAVIRKELPEFDVRPLGKELTKRGKHADGGEKSADQFLPLVYVERLRQEAPVITFDGRVYQYREGVYAALYPEEVDQRVLQWLGLEAHPHQLDSVRKMLNSVCFVRSDNVNPKGLLNLKNCVLDLFADEILEHSPDILSTVQAETAFDKDATCPIWLQTLEEIFPDRDTRQLIAQIFGYCLTADISFQKAFVFYGEGSNGKSLITDVLEALVGPENCEVDPSVKTKIELF